LKTASRVIIGRRSFFQFVTLLRLVAFVRKNGIEIVHGNSGKDYWLAILTGLLAFRKIVLTRHLMAPFSRHTRWLVRSLGITVIVPSQVTLDVLRDSGVPAANLVRIYNGIEPSNFGPRRGNERQAFRIPEGGFVIGILSNLHFPRGKGHFTILESVPELIGRIPLVFWIIAGDGPLLPTLIQRSRELGIENRVIFTGNLSSDRVPRFLSALDLFLLLSYDQEGGCPLALMEAMASRLPVIASRVGGNPELVVDGKTGFLIPPENVQELVRCTLSLYADSGLREQMGTAGEARVREYFNRDRMTAETSRTYRNLLERQS
jgi:glycosyltransferase involved in cell wall biosynthesis